MRLRYLPVLFIPAFAFLTIYVSEDKSPDSFDTNRETIVLRKIGHEILLNAGDSHSRVLPIHKISDQEFRIYFENPVSLVPDSVVNIVSKIAKENKLPEYSVNISDCRKKEIVYGFAISNFSNNQNIVPCLGRELPKDCYYISLLLPARKKGLLNLYYIGAVLAAAALLLFWLRSRFKRKPAPGITPKENTEKKNVVQVGKYSFCPEQQYLELDEEKISLTNKETSLLYILSAAPNTVIERSLLQKEVWENEGVIVTRSLDMFISKLRKKLSGDTNIKIVNVHGKGYKLEIV
ncbi:MAG: winged helix-turn-helix domain-containing protein [Bacteroidota bacterium]